jgi:hypothetical protein
MYWRSDCSCSTSVSKTSATSSKPKPGSPAPRRTEATAGKEKRFKTNRGLHNDHEHEWCLDELGDTHTQATNQDRHADGTENKAGPKD